MALVPPPGFPRSELDGRLRELLLDALRGAAWLPARGRGRAGPRPRRVAGPARRRPGAARAARRGRVRPAAGVRCRGRARVPGARAGRARRAPAEPRPSWSSGCSASTGRPAGGARCTRRWTPAADTVPGLLDELRALPVPLADGRLVAGPPTVLLPPTPDAGPTRPGRAAGRARAARPAHRRPATPCTRCSAASAPAPPTRPTLLEHPALAAAVDRSLDDAEAGLDPAPLAEAVLALVGELPGAPRRPASARSPCPTPTATRPAPTS